MIADDQMRPCDSSHQRVIILPDSRAVDGEPTRNVIAKGLCRPLTELGRHLGVDSVADGENGVEVVVICLIYLSIGGSYPEFPDN